MLFEQWQQQYQGLKPVRVLNDGTSSPEGRLGAIGDIQFVLEREQPQEDLLVLAGDNVLGFGLAGVFGVFFIRWVPTVFLSVRWMIRLSFAVSVWRSWMRRCGSYL
ncbi:hypothetical protein ACFSQ7_02745 [Paenibacillus rhizoplanae]